MRERRRSQRIDKELPLRLKLGQFDLSAESRNISSSGVYCRVNKYIEPMTKLKVILLLPVRLKNNKSVTRKIDCSGVVVRAEKLRDDPEEFNIAIFFNCISQANINAIQRYINDHLRVSPSPGPDPAGCLSRYPCGAN